MQDFCVILRPRRGRLRNPKKKKVLESKLSDGELIRGYQGTCRISAGHAGFLRNPSPSPWAIAQSKEKKVLESKLSDTFFFFVL